MGKLQVEVAIADITLHLVFTEEAPQAEWEPSPDDTFYDIWMEMKQEEEEAKRNVPPVEDPETSKARKFFFSKSSKAPGEREHFAVYASDSDSEDETKILGK